MAIKRFGQLLAMLLIASVPVSVEAQDIASSENWPGYRRTTEITLPFAQIVQSAAVRIEATYVRDSETTVNALTTVATADQPIVVDHGKLDADSRAMQIETCRRQGLAICPILSVRGSGSGFIDNGDQLYTCRHVVGDWPLAASLLNNVPVANVIPPLIIRDWQGQLLYNSAYSDNVLRFNVFDDDPRLDEPGILRYRALGGRPLPKVEVNYAQTLQYLLKASDFVGLRSDSNLIAPVPLASSGSIAEGDVFYLSGFPSETDITPRHYDGQPDKVLVSSVLTTKVYSASLPLMMAAGLQRPGGSGGIVTDVRGEVVGMSCFADSANAYAFAFDTGAQQQFWTALKGSAFADVFSDLPQEAAARN